LSSRASELYSRLNNDVPYRFFACEDFKASRKLLSFDFRLQMGGLDEVRGSSWSSCIGCRSLAWILLDCTSTAAAAPIAQYDVFRNQQRARQGRRLGWARRSGPSLPDTGAGSRCRRQDLAGVLEHPGGGQSPTINARDRIGRGPWQNFKSEVVAQNVEDLHSDNNKLGMQISLTERGTIIPGVGYTPNRHDVLTGSQMDGRAFAAGDDKTCRNWTSSAQGAAMVGHIDRKGLRDDAASRSWNSSHPSRGPDGGCSQADLRSTGGDGLFYCFAAQ
jgi:hypothetical protein